MYIYVRVFSSFVLWTLESKVRSKSPQLMYWNWTISVFLTVITSWSSIWPFVPDGRMAGWPYGRMQFVLSTRPKPNPFRSHQNACSCSLLLAAINGAAILRVAIEFQAFLLGRNPSYFCQIFESIFCSWILSSNEQVKVQMTIFICYRVPLSKSFNL